MPRFSFFLIFPFLPGCLAFGYPSATYTPPVASLPPDVHAFKWTYNTGGMSMIMTGGERVSTKVEKLPIEDGRLDSLHHAYFAYFLGGVPVSFSEHHRWKILLYRPGYEMLEIPSHWCGQKVFQPNVDRLPWTPAKDLNSQLAALDVICPAEFATPSAEVRRFVDLERERLNAIIRPLTHQKLTNRQSAGSTAQTNSKTDP